MLKCIRTKIKAFLSIFNIVDSFIHLPHKSNLLLDIQEFHRKYAIVPADKAANNIVVVCRLHSINTLEQELNGIKACEETSTDEKTVVNSHSNELPFKFAVNDKERQDKLRTMYWLP